MGLIKKAKRGFTLVELVVVIAVIAVLAAVSVGAYFGITESANKSKLEQEARGILNNIQLISNGNDSNSYMDKDGVHIKDINAYEARLNEMSGMTYDVVTEEPATISRQTVWFINTRVDEPSTQVSLSPSSYTTYYRFGYYTPDVGGKIANYSFLTNKCEIVSKDFNIEKDENEEIAPDVGTIYATSFEVPSEINVKVGTSTQLIVENVTPSNGKYFYEVSSNNYFEFEPTNGSIRGISQGTGSIRVYANEFSKTVTINVSPQDVALASMTVKAVNDEGTEISNIDVGGQFGVQVGYIPENTTQKGYTIDILPAGGFTKDLSTDKYTAVKPGHYTIKGTSTVNDEIVCETSILVNDVRITDFILNVEKDSITSPYNGENIELKVDQSINVSANYGETEPTSPIFSCETASNNEILINKVEDTFTVRVLEGATINNVYELTFKASNGSSVKHSTLKIKVVETPVAGILIDNANISMIHHSSIQLNATAKPSNATNTTLKYKLSDGASEIITVTEDGYLTANAVGTSRVTVYAPNTNVSNEFNVTVNPLYISSLTISTTLTNNTINIGEVGHTISCTYQPSNVTNPSYAFKSSDTNLLEIDSEGKILAKAPGNVDVYVYATDDNSKTIDTAIKSNIISIRVTNIKRVYFLDKYWWHGDNCKTYAYTYYENNDTIRNNDFPGLEATLEKTFESTSTIKESKLYYYDVDFGVYTHIIFCRKDSTTNDVWSETENINLSELGANNLIVLRDAYYKGKTEGKCTTFATTYDPLKVDSNYGQYRIYFLDQSWWNKDGAVCTIFTHDSSAISNYPGKYMYKTTINSINYWYFDFDIAIADIGICRFNPSNYGGGKAASSDGDWNAETIRIRVTDMKAYNLIKLSSNEIWKSSGKASVSYDLI